MMGFSGCLLPAKRDVSHGEISWIRQDPDGIGGDRCCTILGGNATTTRGSLTNLCYLFTMFEVQALDRWLVR